MNPKLPKTTWSNYHSGFIPQPKRKVINYSLYYANRVHIYTGDYGLCKHYQKQNLNSKIKPNYAKE